MKKPLLIIFIAAISLAHAFAQSTTTSFDVNGIKVIFKPTSKSVINVRFYYRGGVTNYPSAKAGLENFAVQAVARCGTQSFTANNIRDTCDKYDIQLNASSNFDYSYLQLNCITKYFNKGWDIFADAVMNPAFDTNEVGLLKNKLMAYTKEVLSTPYSHLSQLAVLSSFKGTPYATDPFGSEETLNAISVEELKNYYQTLLNKNKVFVVVVGNVTKEELTEKLFIAFGNIIGKPFLKPEYDTPEFNDNSLFTEQRQLPVGYLAAITNAPKVSSVDYIPYRLGISALSNTLFHELSTQQKIAYNPEALCWSDQMSYGEINLATNKPRESMTGIIKIIKDLQKSGVNEEWLTRLKNSFVITNFINEQSASAVTNNLGLAEINSGWQYADDLPQLVYLSTAEQVNKALKTYLTGVKWIYLGNVATLTGFTPPPF